MFVSEFKELLEEPKSEVVEPNGYFSPKLSGVTSAELTLLVVE